MKSKLIVILGPTATGKTDLALSLAKKYRGEIISADSRAIYKGLDIGTAKPLGKWHVTKTHGREKCRHFISRGIVHHLLDFLSPKKTFSAANFVKLARTAVADIQARGKLPIVCGGTGFWIDALLNPRLLADVPPDRKLRESLAKLTTTALLARLKKLDPKKAQTIDPNNRRRLIRAIEIASFSLRAKRQRSREAISSRQARTISDFDVLYLGLTLPNTELKKRIRTRFLKWLKQGLAAETKKLAQTVSKKRLKEIGLAYPIVADYLDKKIDLDQMIERSVNSIYHYGKRQKTWFVRNKKIRWLKGSYRAERLVDKFLEGN